VNVQIRVGLNTGEVVVRSIRTDDLHTDYIPIGHSTSLAARMEGLATPGSIVVSEHTHKLAEGYFEFQSLGAAQVKGVSKPIQIYEVLGVGPLRTRLQVSTRRGLVRFVGRQRELEHLRKSLELAKAGHGQIVAMVGEPGVGKSRLCYEFKAVTQQDCLVLETFSVSHGKAYPYLPLIELLKSYFHIMPQDEEQLRQEKMTGNVLALDRSLEDALPYLFALLGVSEPTSSLRQMDPQVRRRRTFEAITRLLVRESLNCPLLILVEDLQWLDSETEAWLHVLSERVATAHILLLVNYRPEYRHSWGSKTYYTQLRLDPLEPEDAQELLTVLLGDDPGLQPLKRLVLTKTEGNPFFIEEIVQALLEHGVLVRDAPVGAALRGRPQVGNHRAVPLPTEIQLPPTVQGVLAARIDRLGREEKALLQTMAVIGKEFSLSLLTRVVGQPEDELQQRIASLQGAEFIYEQPAFPDPEYTFKHALTQEVAYNSLLIERRRELHERSAQAIEALFRDRLEEYYRELAHHYRHSGNTEKAVIYLQRAGQQGVQRSAYVEAISLLTKGLELLKTLPDTPARAQQELTLLMALGVPLTATKGPAALEVGAVYTRARELCQQVCEPLELFPVLWGLRLFYTNRGEYQTARELGEQLLSLAQHVHDPALLLQAHRALAAALLYLGEFAAARAHFEQAMALYDPQRHYSLAFDYGGQNPEVSCRSLTAWALWMLGYPDRALKRSQEALTLAQELAHPHSLGFALYFAAVLPWLRREGQRTQERAEALMALCREHGFAELLALGMILRGWALAAQGQAADGVAQIHQGLAAYQATGAELLRPYFLALLGETYGSIKQTEEGLTTLAEALAAMSHSEQRYYGAELYRLKGELLLARSPAPRAEAEACFRQALDIARRQSAKSLELRAAMSLSRLWQQQGKRDEARQLLAEIYGWFTEGFDTADLQEAKALLDALA
jgi:predicted ATPase